MAKIQVINELDDSKLVATVLQFMQEAAAMVGLEYGKIDFSPLRRRKNEHYIIGGGIDTDLIDGTLMLKIDEASVRQMPQDVLRTIMHHCACHARDAQEGIYGNRIYVIGEQVTDNPFYVLAQEINESYGDYFACQRQEKVFGKDALRKYQLHGLDDFFERIDTLIEEADDYIRSLGDRVENEDLQNAHQFKVNLVYGLFKEYIKNMMIGYEHPMMRPSITQLSKKMMPCFDLINGTQAEAIEKSKMMMYMGCVMIAGHDMMESYCSGNIVDCHDDKAAEIAEDLPKKMGLDKKEFAQTIEGIRKEFGYN